MRHVKVEMLVAVTDEAQADHITEAFAKVGQFLAQNGHAVGIRVDYNPGDAAPSAPRVVNAAAN